MLLDAIEDVCSYVDIKVIFVYLEEAHSIDSWPLTSGEDAPRSHRNNYERLVAAEAFLSEYPEFASLVQDRWYLDNMENSLAIQNGLWPERYLLLEGSHVCWASTLSFEERFTDISQSILDAASRWQ